MKKNNHGNHSRTCCYNAYERVLKPRRQHGKRNNE